MDGSNEEVKNTEPAKAVKEERKEEKEVKEKKRNSQFYESTPRTNSKTVKSVYPSKKFERVSKEPLSKEGILDPLDLLEPVYEEVTRESALPKMREIRNIPMKKGRLKKRKFSEEREEVSLLSFKSIITIFFSINIFWCLFSLRRHFSFRGKARGPAPTSRFQNTTTPTTNASPSPP